MNPVVISREERAISPGRDWSIRNLMPSFKSAENRITYPPTCKDRCGCIGEAFFQKFQEREVRGAEANCEAEREMDFMPGPLEQVTDFLPRTDGNFAGNRGCGLWESETMCLRFENQKACKETYAYRGCQRQ